MEKLTEVQLRFINDTLNGARSDLDRIKEECYRLNFHNAAESRKDAYNCGVVAQAADAARDAIAEFLIAASVYAPGSKLDIWTTGEQEAAQRRSGWESRWCGR